MSAKDNNQLGYKTEEALQRLHDEIEAVVKQDEQKFVQKKFLEKCAQLLAKPYECPLGWFPVLMTIFVICCLFITQHYFIAIVIGIILCETITLVLRESNLRRTEIHRKIRYVLNEIQCAKILSKDWTKDNYPNLCCPLSPCVTLQWTYRDGNIVNLPWALLVKGDYVVLRPGQISPGHCIEVKGKHVFQSGETYGHPQPADPPLRPTARGPLPDLICIMQTTPYLESLQTCLDNFLKRPSTIYNKQRHLLITKYIQQWGFLLALGICLIFGCLRHFGIIFERGHWTELFIELPACSLIPILPLVFPIMWIALNLWGIARLETLLNITLPLTVTNEAKSSFQEDLDTPTFEWEKTRLPAIQVMGNWFDLWHGSSNLLGRSTDVVQVLGSITALCCVDKKGILSWPNPTAEKVFFLRDASDKTSKISKSSLDSDDSKNEKSGTAVAEVLDLTHDQHSPFKLEFDDHEWKDHVNSLKPLGLAILVNTCCPLTQEYYARFCGHVTAVAMLDKDLVPVTNRYAIVESRMNSFMHGRCLCELAKQIGFTPQARAIFTMEGQISSYMYLQPDVLKRDIRFARQLQLTSKVKVPFPHCLSVVMRENHSGSLQLLTQGTADIVLDCCDDFWDGKDLCPLGPQERKRAQDFYQRSALTAYCTAFSYRPLRHGISGALSGEDNGNTAYLELPPESKYRMSQFDHNKCGYGGTLHHSISSDSLLFSENKDGDINDVDGCFEMQCHQVFIGMVTMQYQAQTDIVQLIEQLDRACIRFVHFSKENELRSRVFSEKMGLESGWNCHISLLSESDSTVPSPKSSRNHDKNPNANIAINIDNELATGGECELNRLLPPTIGLETSKNLSSSAPGAISDQNCSLMQLDANSEMNGGGSSSIDVEFRHRASKDSAMEDENCHSISCFTDSTEQSAPVNFDMSNRAKLPRGIENIRPHLENVDNVPLLVSLFTDCSAEATREMLKIMQSYNEIVVCMGSSASNANAEIFLQANCSVAIEPLYPQVCQDIPTYTESNILNNQDKATIEQTEKKTWCKLYDMKSKDTTVSPIYLSRMLNSIPCSISICRDDNLSIVSLIELSRRFSNGLWSCIQFWACCGCSLALMNTLCACLSLPPMLTPESLVYLMAIAIPVLSISLVRVEPDPKVMQRASGKKQTKFDSSVFIFVLCCYGCKFLPTILIMILAHSTFMSHPIDLLNTLDIGFHENLNSSRTNILVAILIHFVIISMSFVHRDYSVWQKNPLTNMPWVITSIVLISFQLIVYGYNIAIQRDILTIFEKVWPIILFLFSSIIIVLGITEICKYQEIKINARIQRRARLDFGTKLGMNSPF